MGVRGKYNRKFIPRYRKQPKTPANQVDLDKLHGSYLLYSPKTKGTYPGYALDPVYRYEQHLGKRAGGAEETRNMNDPKLRILAVVCPFMNVRDGKDYEGSVISRSNSPWSRLRWMVEALMTANQLWSDDSTIPAGDERRAPLGPFHFFLFPNLPLKDKQYLKLMTLLAQAQKQNKVVIHRDATIAQVSKHWEQELASRKSA